MGRALIIGGDGTFGRALRPALAARGYEVRTTSRRPIAGQDAYPLDLARDPGGWQPPERPDIVFLCAAVTGLADCERDPEGSRRINVVNTLILMRELAASGCRIVYPSTNLVLAGDAPFQPADERPQPGCEYARQKAEVEAALRELGSGAAILRMTKVIAPRTPLVSGWVRALRAGLPIHPLSDLMLAPMPLAGLIDSLVTVGLDGEGGIYQVTGAEDMSYAAFAARIAARLGHPADLVQPASSAELGIKLEASPRHTTLDGGRAERELGIKPFVLDETLNRMVFDAV